MRLNDALITNERYRGEPSTSEDGRTQWPVFILWDDELQGFGVRIHPPVRGKPSRKDFIVTWRVGLRSRTMALGTFGVDCSLRQARKAAREALDLARRGQDPLEARQRALGIGTPEDLASRFLFEHSAAAKRKNVPGGDPPSPTEEMPGANDLPESSEVVGSPEASAASRGPVPSAVAPPEAAAAAGPLPDGLSTPHPVSAAPAPDAPAAAPSAPNAAPSTPNALETTDADGRPGAEDRVGLAAAASTTGVAGPRATESAPPARRGTAKMRFLSIPESLHRDLERRSRASSLTIAGYLQALLEREGETLEPDPAGASPLQPEAQSTRVASPAEILSRVEATQSVAVATVGAATFDDGQDHRGD